MIKKILSYSAGVYAAAVFASFVRLFVKSLVAKTLGKEALGAYAYYNAVLLLGCALLVFGLNRTIAKEVAARKDERQFAPLVTAVMTLMAAASLALSGLAFLFNQRLDWIYMLILISVGPATLFDIALTTLRGQFDQKREIIAVATGVLIQAACIAVMIQLFHNSRAPVVGLTVSYVMLALGVGLYFRRRYSEEWQPRRLWGVYQSVDFHSLLLLSAPLWIADVLGIISQQMDQYIVQGQLGYSVLAEYAAAYTLIGLMDQPIAILSRVFLVTFASGFYNKFEEYRQVLALNLALFSVVGFMVIALSVPLTPLLFTNAYTMVPVLVMILSITSIFQSVEVINSSLTIAQDYPQANRNAKIWSIIIYIPLAFLLVSRFGVLGAAWSNVASWAGYTVFHALYMRKTLPAQAKHTMRTLLLGVSLYAGTIWIVWMSKSIWLVLVAIPVYLGAGQLLRLWDLTKFPRLVRHLLPKSMAFRQDHRGG